MSENGQTKASTSATLSSMDIESESCYRALAARDVRFDGLFFVGVTTTGIYCRPVCTARTPRRDRCRFFPSAAAAERDAFRPCLRCRPELAPGSAPVDAAGRIARTVAERIEAGALDDETTLEQLAKELGLGSRQVRRIVRRELGVSPVELAQTHRLLLAKQLLTETQLPVVEVAFASGFGSLRRFNTLFRSHYQLPPSRLRRSTTAVADASVNLSLAYRPPLAWQAMLRFLSARAMAGVECVTDRTYARTVALRQHQGWFCAEPVKGRAVLALEISTSLVPVLGVVLMAIKNLFDLHARPDAIDSHLAGDGPLAATVRRTPGLRVPGAFSGFELALRAVLGQQVSVHAATTLAGRVVAAFGEPIATPIAGLSKLSPTAERIAGASQSEIARLGINGARAECLRSLAIVVAEGKLRLEPALSPDVAVTGLLEVRGIGQWTAQYIAMRALRWPDAFPHGDLGLRKALGLRTTCQVLEASQAWRPWRAYAAMHLWMKE
jgi:AraC family transcriptional regulator of adaptative response / DNA-3-methyladenine glycosylase II